LKVNGFQIEKRGNGHAGLLRSTETKTNISKSKLGKPNFLKRGKKYTIDQRLNIIKSMHNYSIDLSEFSEDINKFKLIKEFAYRHLVDKSETAVLRFIRRFYYDDGFSRIYENWKANGFEKLFKPSIDHVVPISRGGQSTIENFQVLTWFENRVKNNMTDEEWNHFKKVTNTSSDLFMR
jgi:hypothetical protein